MGTISVSMVELRYSLFAAAVLLAVQAASVSELGVDDYGLTTVAQSLCENASPLPEGAHPARLNTKTDPAQECASRCDKALGSAKGFYLRNSDKSCMCSKGDCVTKTDAAYTAYKVTAEPADIVPRVLEAEEADEVKFKTKEKQDMVFRKGLFRMGMKFQGLLDQLAKTSDKTQANELKAQLAKLEKKVPKKY